MIKIGIIDTEIRTDQIIFDKTHFCNADYKTSVLHGTEVANVLLSLNPYLDITAIPVSYTHLDVYKRQVTFTTYREAERYQKVHNLENTSMIEQQCFRREQMVIAA